MIADVGYGALIVSLILAVWGSAAAALGAARGRAPLIASAQHAALGVFVLITAALVLLVYAFLTFDFSVRYVANNTNRGTPFYYRITAAWGALEGSIVLWAWMLAVYTLVVILRHRENARDLYPWALSVMLGVLAFFVLVMTVSAPPFERLSPAPADGRGLNPLLEDSGMITHPVALYLGFTGFTVPFAFAMAALATGRLDDRWIAITRRWTIVAWYFLSLGLLIGGWWSYHVLGWGGYWAWDPVENAAFMPWLTGTAFLHSVMVQERRRLLKLWNAALVVLTFALTLFGTFLTRSGVIASVHAFSRGTVGLFFLGFLAVVVRSALSLLALRWDRLRSEGTLDSVISRESTFLLNNVLLVAIAFAVFFGTVFPLVSEALTGVKVSVWAPFFNQVNVPLFLAVIFLMGVGPLIAWRRASVDNLKRDFVVPVLVGAVAAAICFALGARSTLAVLALALTVFVAATVTLDFVRATRARLRMNESLVPAMGRLLVRHNRRYGGFLVHLGILVVAVGVTGSHAWSVQTETTVQRGEAAELAGYRFRFDGLRPSEESNHSKVTGVFTVTNGRAGRVVLLPAKKFYPQEMWPIAYVDYRLGLIEDVYLVLGDFARDGSQATVKIQVNRLVSWIWLGGVVLTLGTALAIWPERRAAAGEISRVASRVTGQWQPPAPTRGRKRGSHSMLSLGPVALAIVGIGTAVGASAQPRSERATQASAATPATPTDKALFDQHCASCHGLNAAGTDRGPALVHVSAQRVRELGIGAGVNDLEIGARLRYEIRRKFAPYVGVAWTGRFGETADFARAEGEPVDKLQFVVGVRFWF